MTNLPFLNIRILSPSAPIFEGGAHTCLMPTPEGVMKVLPRHMPVAGRLSPGAILLMYEDGESTSYEVPTGGFYRVGPDEVHIWLH